MAAAIECVGVEKRYKDFTLGPVSFSLQPGFITGIIGINGAGKTTLLHILAGIDRRFEGDILYNGTGMRKNLAALRQNAAIISDKIPFFLDKTPLENALLLGKYFDNWRMEDFYGWMDRLALPKGKPVYQFSKGMKTKFQLCFAMAHHAEYLLLDEPTAGLDPVFRKDFLRILQDIRNEGTGILMSTHITGDLDCIADYVLLLDHGQIKLNATREALEDKVRRQKLEGYMEKNLHIGELLRYGKTQGGTENGILRG